MTEDFQKNLLKVLDYYYKQEQKLKKEMDELRSEKDIFIKNVTSIKKFIIDNNFKIDDEECEPNDYSVNFCSDKSEGRISIWYDNLSCMKKKGFELNGWDNELHETSLEEVFNFFKTDF